MQKHMIDIISEKLGKLGRLMVYIGILCGCYLVWKLIIQHIIIK